MEYAYRADAWQALYTAVAGAAAALTGLLFIALSLNLRTIVKIPMYRARARETLGGLLCLLVLSVILLIPGQERHVLGVELIVASVIMLLSGVRLQIQTLGKLPSHRRMRWLLRLVLINTGSTTILIAGISLIVGQFGGLLWLMPTILIYLLWSLNNAWLLVVQVAEEAT